MLVSPWSIPQRRKAHDSHGQHPPACGRVVCILCVYDARRTTHDARCSDLNRTKYPSWLKPPSHRRGPAVHCLHRYLLAVVPSLNESCSPSHPPSHLNGMQSQVQAPRMFRGQGGWSYLGGEDVQRGAAIDRREKSQAPLHRRAGVPVGMEEEWQRRLLRSGDAQAVLLAQPLCISDVPGILFGTSSSACWSSCVSNSRLFDGSPVDCCVLRTIPRGLRVCPSLLPCQLPEFFPSSSWLTPRLERFAGCALCSPPAQPVQFCYDYCAAMGAPLMATQWGIECWCATEVVVETDFKRHGEDEVKEEVSCDYPCPGNPVR